MPCILLDSPYICLIFLSMKLCNMDSSVKKQFLHTLRCCIYKNTYRDIEKALKSPADYILLDQGGGGTGQTFDWSLIPEIDRPFFLAGGLGADNLETAVRTIHPYAVDLSSSVETDGMKDRDKILKAVQLVHIK